MNKTLKRVLLVIGCVLLALVLVAGGYVLYIVLQYSRIPDGTALDIENPQAAMLQTGERYTALTFNIGFGAYDHDFSFFMDTGEMLDGTPVAGRHARAQSRAIVEQNTAGVLALAQRENPDFCLLQEVDVRAQRSFKIDQVAAARAAFPEHASVYASNFHSAYLAYPFHEPHGAVEAGLVTLSRYAATQAVRRSFPVDESFPTKFFDLDRCFSVLRLPVEGGGELVLINLHMSAFDEGGRIRAAQMDMLAGALAEERARGNWVVAGGDFNHALCGTLESFPSQQKVPGWIFPFSDDRLPAGFSVVCASNVREVPTCRSSDMAYTPGVNYLTVVDGFIVSDNVRAAALNIDANFLHSDHNPVKLEFVLE